MLVFAIRSGELGRVKRDMRPLCFTMRDLHKSSQAGRAQPGHAAGPANVHQLAAMTRAWYQAGVLEQGEASCAKILAVEPNHIDAIYLLGALQSRKWPLAGGVGKLRSSTSPQS